MHGTVSLPTWLAILLAVLAAWAALDRLLLPGARWVLRRRVNRVLDELNTRLKIRIQPFKLTKREVLIDRLLYDPQVQQAAEAYAREGDMPRELAMRQGAGLRARDRAGLQRLRLLPLRLLARAQRRAHRSTACGSATRTRRGSPRSRRRRPSSSSSTTAPTWTTSSSPTSRRRRRRCPTRSGEWARIWPLQSLVRAMGAYFVRRNSKDPLYRQGARALRGHGDGGGRHAGGVSRGRPLARRPAARRPGSESSTTCCAPSIRRRAATSSSCRSGSTTTERSRTAAFWSTGKRRRRPARS